MKELNDIGAIILAAGAGRRIGQPKWQLRYQGKTFLDIIVANLCESGINDIVCVVRSDSVPPKSNIIISINPHPENGMFSSIFRGVQAIPRASGYMIFPIDHPLVTVETLKLLQENFLFDKNIAVSPIYADCPGHPIIISSHIAHKITNSDFAGGLKSFLVQEKAKMKFLEVNDKGSVTNINTYDAIEYLPSEERELFE